ncbi:MAG: GNAT family N-acetyltransferase, partial [Lachnospiraceae bacterium]|nr:GNAT family N-acetyltransferase [Lachnospiraceae bacterium]
MSEIMIKPLTPDLAEDYAYFFDITPHDDGTDKDELPCYCVTWRGDESYELDGEHWFVTREERREKAIGFVKSGALQGYLAYMDEKIVGWCNANANCRYCRDYLRGFWNIDEYDPAVKIKSVFCFMIAPQAQKKGVATKLLERVCVDAAADGFDFIEAHVYEEGKAGPYDFTGPIALYEKCGFTRYTMKDKYVVMRKTL